MGDDPDFYRLILTGSVHNFTEVILRNLALIAFLSMLLASCQKPDNVVVDSSQPINVQLAYFGKDSLDIAQYVNEPSSHLTIVDSFLVTLSSVQNFSNLGVRVQNDSGSVLTEASFSSITGNAIGGTLSVVPSSIYVGDLTYTFTAYNNNGVPGNYAAKLVRLYNSSNNPPVIDSVSVPDSVQIDSVNTIVFSLYAAVYDPYGLNDISKVYFNTTKPDGTPSSGNPWIMYDDGGASGLPGDDDAIANDGIYTLTIQLPPGTTLGVYKFAFYAVNRSGISSAPVFHNLKVYQ